MNNNIFELFKRSCPFTKSKSEIFFLPIFNGFCDIKICWISVMQQYIPIMEQKNIPYGCDIGYFAPRHDYSFW